MKILHCHNAIVPIDQIASIYIQRMDRNRDDCRIKVVDVTGRVHTYASPSTGNEAGQQLDNLAHWLQAGAPHNTEPERR